MAANSLIDPATNKFYPDLVLRIFLPNASGVLTPYKIALLDDT
jgi:hypothetical protein